MQRLLPREAWGYGALLILLLTTAGIAVWYTIGYIGDQISGDAFRIAALLVWSLTLGFMLIAGAFGLWAIRFSAEAESRRRIGRVVDAMHYLSDGLAAIDSKGCIRGSNPAIKELSRHAVTPDCHLSEIFPCLSKREIKLLANAKTPREIEHDTENSDGPRTLRFRSQPSEGLTLVLASDVTAMNEQRSRRRQTARLQLIGELAQAVAHDFDNLLCGISGHASLLTRVAPGSQEMEKSITAISDSSRRGVALANHLLELATLSVAAYPSDAVGEHVKAAVEALRGSLPEQWQVEQVIDDEPRTVALTGMQVEQVILNLGLLAADFLTRPGVLQVCVGKFSHRDPARPEQSLAGTIRITGYDSDMKEPPEDIIKKSPAQTGVIASVIRTTLEGAGGHLDSFVAAHGVVYEVGLPRGQAQADDSEEIPDELKSYISRWTVLYGGTRRESSDLDSRMRQAGLTVNRLDDIAAILACIEENSSVDAMLLQERLLGKEPRALLKAILKIRPACGVVVLCENAEISSRGLTDDIVFLATTSEVSRVVLGLIDSKGLAAHRLKR
ncbi:MAG: hypothetical protein QGI24_05990 [Kiritimatiellia bacterium]|jgi:signal transduction histidine kinase|nr:hypothetical protein [Kiritimatiellia bacterium]MDP6848319.1 hypothetical protein [Kiritimatiellia bacterium]